MEKKQIQRSGARNVSLLSYEEGSGAWRQNDRTVLPMDRGAE